MKTEYTPAPWTIQHGHASRVYLINNREGHAIARYFAAQGLTIAVLKYRLPAADTFETGLPASQQDALEGARATAPLPVSGAPRPRGAGAARARAR